MKVVTFVPDVKFLSPSLCKILYTTREESVRMLPSPSAWETYLPLACIFLTFFTSCEIVVCAPSGTKLFFFCTSRKFVLAAKANRTDFLRLLFFFFNSFLIFDIVLTQNSNIMDRIKSVSENVAPYYQYWKTSYCLYCKFASGYNSHSKCDFQLFLLVAQTTIFIPLKYYWQQCT